MKKLFQILGGAFIVSGLLFLLIHNNIFTISPDESFARDLFGLPIPNPPLWVSNVPRFGWGIGIIFEYFSIHGLAGITVTGFLFFIGGVFINIADKKDGKRNKQQEVEEIITNPNLPDVIKQEFIQKAKKGENENK